MFVTAGIGALCTIVGFIVGFILGHSVVGRRLADEEIAKLRLEVRALGDKISKL